MRTLFLGLILGSLSVNCFAAVPAFAAAAPAQNPAAENRSIAWKNDLVANPSDRTIETPSLLLPVDSPDIDRSGTDSVQNVPVEAVPTPTAVTSGLLVLSGLAAVRLFRKLRFA